MPAKRSSRGRRTARRTARKRSSAKKPAYMWTGKTRSVVYKIARRKSGTRVFRPSARKVYDSRKGANHYAFYDGKMHKLEVRRNGSPYWKVLPAGAKVPGRVRRR